jgi:hypothetical protein
MSDGTDYDIFFTGTPAGDRKVMLEALSRGVASLQRCLMAVDVEETFKGSPEDYAEAERLIDRAADTIEHVGLNMAY